LIFVFAGILCSCSVKEERGECPCYLEVDISKTLDAGYIPFISWNTGMKIKVYSDSTCLNGIDVHYQDAEEEQLIPVKKSEVSVACILGAEKSILKGHRLILPEGNQADPLYISSDFSDCTGESSTVQAHFFKQYSNVYVTGLKDVELSMTVTGNSSGIDLLTRQATEGSFSYRLEKEESGDCSFRLPRMADDKVMIMLYDSENVLKNVIPLGKVMTSCGYDWNADWLADISVNIDSVTALITVTISGWTQVIEYPYIL